MSVTPPVQANTRGLLRAGVPGLLAGLATVVLIIALYMWIPQPSRDDPPWVVLISIVVITLIYSAAAVWALLRITRARHPMRTGFVMLAVMVTAMVVIFALAYLALSVDNPANFNVPLDKVDSLYFTMTILSTVGFGDIVAESNPARIAVMVQMVVGLTLLTALTRVLIEAARRAARRRFSDEEPAE